MTAMEKARDLIRSKLQDRENRKQAVRDAITAAEVNLAEAEQAMRDALETNNDAAFTEARKKQEDAKARIEYAKQSLNSLNHSRIGTSQEAQAIFGEAYREQMKLYKEQAEKVMAQMEALAAEYEKTERICQAYKELADLWRSHLAMGQDDGFPPSLQKTAACGNYANLRFRVEQIKKECE